MSMKYLDYVKSWKPTNYPQHYKVVAAYMKQPPRLCRPEPNKEKKP